MDKLNPFRSSIGTKIVLVIALILALGFVLIFALPYVLWDPEKMGRYSGREIWVFVHVSIGIIALLVGPVQFWLAWKTKFVTHRTLGRIYLIAVLLSALSSFYLAVNNDISWLFGLGLGGLGFAWLLTSGVAFYAIRRKKIELHREWMTRSYIVTMGFVFFRIFLGLTSAFEIGDIIQRLEGASWTCWAFPLLIGEFFIQRKKLLA